MFFKTGFKFIAIMFSVGKIKLVLLKYYVYNLLHITICLFRSLRNFRTFIFCQILIKTMTNYIVF